MAWVWTTVGTMGLVAGIAIALVAGLVYWANPRRLQNRLLALILALNGMGSMTGIGLMYLTSDRTSTYGWQVVATASFLAMAVLYLAFLSTLATPMARPLARVRVPLYVLAAAAFLFVVLFPRPFITGTEPGTFSPWEATIGPAGVAVAPAGIGVSLLGIVFAFSAYRRATGLLARSQALAYLVAFAWADTRIIFEAVANLTVGFVEWVGVVDAIAAFIFPVLLAYGIFKTQLFDIDLKIKWTLSRGTVATAFLLVFFVVSQLIERLASEKLGYISGAAAAGVLLLAINPLQKAADKLADKAMPKTEATPAYVVFRKMEVYKAAVEELSVGGVSAKERRALDALRGKLGISTVDALALEKDISTLRGVA